jgi:hypothetical protein
MEMPRPTVRRWCEHGYDVAFDATRTGLLDKFAAAAEEMRAKEAEDARAAEAAKKVHSL